MSKTNFEDHMKHLKSPGEMKLMIKFYLRLHNFSELWNLFSYGKLFLGLFQANIHLVSF